MIRSMTAFARQEDDTPWGGLIWELRTVNHRYLDIGLRLPDELRALEPRVRETIGKHLGRGKVDAALRFQPKETATGTFELDAEQARRLCEAAGRIGELAENVSPLRAIDVLRWPGVLQLPQVDIETLTEAALSLLARTLTSLVEMRTREGGRLQELIHQRLDAMAQTVDGVKKILPETIEAYRTRLQDKLQDIRQQLDPARLEQEIVLFAQRSDVAEELDRLVAHIDEVKRALEGKGQVGRRLDFLMQEFNRESNTLGSKAADIRVTNAAVELKVLIEQMREQVQNIE